MITMKTKRHLLDVREGIHIHFFDHAITESISLGMLM